MKNLLLVISIVLLGGTAFSQTFDVKDVSGSSIVGTTVTIPYYLTPTQLADTTTDLYYYAAIQNISAGTVDTQVKRRDQVCLAGTKNYYCWAQCFGKMPGCDSFYYLFPDSILHPSSYHQWIPMSAGQEIPADGNGFAAHHMPYGVTGTACYEFVVFDYNNPMDSVWFTLCFEVNLASGIEEQSLDVNATAYPSPANDYTTIEYSTEFDISDLTLNLYSSIGQLIRQVELNAKEGVVTLDTYDLESGTYFYAFEAEGTITRAEHLVVTH